jgi:outer membrane protein TolC
MSHRGVEIVLGRLAADEAPHGRFARGAEHTLAELAARRAAALAVALAVVCAPPLAGSEPPPTVAGAISHQAATAADVTPATRSPAEAEVLTLEAALALAIESNRSLGVAALEVKRAEQRVAAARTRRFPTLNMEVTAGTTLNTIRVHFPAGAFGAFPGTGPIPAVDTAVEAERAVTGQVNASLAQPLTQLYRIGLNTKLNELTRDVERQRLRSQRATTIAETRRLYYNLVQAQGALAAAEAQVGVYRELDRVVGEQLAQEAALKADSLEVKARLAAEEHRAAGLRNDEAALREQLNHQLGRDLAHPFEVVPVATPSLEEVDLQSALSRAVAQRPELAQARLAVDQADTDRRIKAAESIPELSLWMQYTSFANVDLLPRNIAVAGVQLKWEPFDWGRRGKEKAEKMLQLEQARTNAKDAESRTRMEVARSFRALQEARLLVDAETLRREAARERLRLATNRHREQAALLKDVLEAQAAVSGADTQYDQGLVTFWNAKADLQKAIGEEQ